MKSLKELLAAADAIPDHRTTDEIRIAKRKLKAAMNELKTALDR